MVRESKDVTLFGTSKARRRRITASRQAVARARVILRGRTLAPLRTGGFFGSWNRPGQLGPELKTIDTIASSQSLSTAGTLILLNGVAQGDDYNTRDGRKIIMKSINLKVYVSNIVNAIADGDLMRVMVLYDSQSNGAAPTAGNILQTVSALAPMNLDNRTRFKVLFDKWQKINGFNYSGGVLTAGTYTPPLFKLYKKLMLDVQFSGTTAAIGSISCGSIYLLVLSQTSTGAAAFDVDSRIRFTEL